MLKDRFALWPSRHRVAVVLKSLGERLHGLDFTLPDRMENRGRADGAMYYASPDGVLQRLFECVAQLHDEEKDYDARVYRGKIPL